jgi:hypothetical protein
MQTGLDVLGLLVTVVAPPLDPAVSAQVCKADPPPPQKRQFRHRSLAA